MGEGKEAYENRRARIDAEHERYEKQHAERLEQDRIGREIVGALADLLTGRRFIAVEQRGSLLKIEVMLAPAGTP